MSSGVEQVGLIRCNSYRYFRKRNISMWQKILLPLAVILGGAALLGAGKPAKKRRSGPTVTAWYCAVCDEPADRQVDGKKYCDEHADQRVREIEAEEDDRYYSRKRR